MGQQLPSLLKGQNAFLQSLQGSTPGNPAQALNGMGSEQLGTAANTSIGGVDPNMMNAAQQSLANPNAGDLSAFPSPKAMGEGALVGVGAAGAMTAMDKAGWFTKAATSLDKLLGGKKLDGWILPQLKQMEGKPLLNELSLASAHFHEIQDGPDKAEKIAAKAKNTVAEMEQRQLNGTLGRYQTRFKKKHSDAVDAAYRETRAAIKKDGHIPYNYLQAFADNKAVHPEARFNTVIEDLEKQIAHLNGIDKNTKTKAQATLQKELRHVKERVSGLNNLYKPLYESQAELTAKLTADGVGPIGRGVASSINYVQRLFNGQSMFGGGNAGSEAAKQTAKEAKPGVLNAVKRFAKTAVPKRLGSLAIPAFMGATVFGFSFHAAHKAQDGEKTKSFFHDFLGSQIFNFVGWEFGRKILNSVQFGDKVFRGAAGKTLPGILSKIPLLGKITLAGFGTELAAGLIVGGIFQKVGEKLAHAIFGKPSKESLDGKPGQQKPSAPGMSPPSANPAQLGGQMNAQMNSGQGNNGMNPAMQAKPSFPQAMGGASFPAQQYGNRPVNGFSQAAGNYGYANRAVGRNAQQSPAMPNQAQPRAHKFSISPDEIRGSQVANAYDNNYKTLLNDKDFNLDKRPTQL